MAFGKACRPVLDTHSTYRLRSGTNAKLIRATADIKRTNSIADVSASTGGSTGLLDLHRKLFFATIGVIIGLVGGLYNLVRESLNAVHEAQEDDAVIAEQARSEKHAGDGD